MENFRIGGSGGGGDGNWIPACDFRRDAGITGGSLRQEQVWVCEACHSAPAAFLCKADAASLCTNCDIEIHSANSLANRHHRVPVFAAQSAHPAAELSGIQIESTVTGSQPVDEIANEADEDEAASWLLFNPVKCSKNQDFVPLYNQHQHHYDVPRVKNYKSDGLVPVHTRGNSLQLGLDYESSREGYESNYPLSHQTASASSMDVGIVPDSTMSNVSISDLGTPIETIDLISGRDQHIPTPPQLSSADREARVLRYREKKKVRKFEKTIRYASRKAYAEIRPRIRGRFVKRSAVEVEDDPMFSTSVHPENGYGIVPSL